MNRTRDHRQTYLIGAALVLATLALYWPAARSEFINLDDPTYVTQNPKVSQGLTGGGVVWAFTSFYGANWHPVTWLAHMLDVTLFGLRPRGHHLMNVGWHLANGLLLFGLLRRLTGAVGRSAIVAALFAWHPLHVESVAWVSERKDVLSTFFGLLALLAYARFAQLKIKNAKLPMGGKVWYGAALAFFALGLMSKPMLVTWPLVMLLLDFWPLKRVTSDGWRVTGKTWQRLVWEKIPFFALTLGSCVLTFLAQRAGGAVVSMERLTLSARLENALVSYARYLGKTVWPAELSAYYPHPVTWPPEVVFGAAILILALVVAALRTRRRQGYGLFGVGWFLITLVPVIGLVQVGGQAIADRYMYIPQIGLLVAIVWGMGDALGGQVRGRRAGAGLAVAACLGCGMVTRQYLPYWENSVRLFQHALEINDQNPPALYSLGLALSTQGKFDEAIPYLLKATEMRPDVQQYQGQLALALENQGDTAGAIARYRRCLELEPNLTEALNNLAWILATSPQAEHRQGADAVKLATRACELTQYEWPMFLGTLAASYAEAGRFPEAIQTAEQAEHMARKRGFRELAERNAALLIEYRAGQAHREPATKP